MHNFLGPLILETMKNAIDVYWIRLKKSKKKEKNHDDGDDSKTVTHSQH